MTPDPALLDVARAARRTGLFAPIAPGMLAVTGADAARFLHAQLTNDVEGLAPGRGNATARVTRTGHLVQIATLHRLPDDSALWLVADPEAIIALHDALDEYVFADDVAFADRRADYAWFALQGPRAADALREAVGGAWDDVPLHAIVSLDDCDAPSGSFAIAKSLTGDVGFVVAVPQADAPLAAFEKRLADAAAAHDLVAPRGEPLDAVLDILRIEAGIVRVGVDTPGRERLLPETGLEQQLVSYTKGCYIGQEVIARVRTYGSLPYALRGLRFARGANLALHGDAARRTLESLPPVGADVRLAGDAEAKPIGQYVSRTLSPVADAPIALAYLDRAHRTPGERLTLAPATDRDDGPLEAEVVLLPFHRTADRDAQVAAHYDRAIRVFADGDEDAALGALGAALELDPTFADGYEAIGVILGRSGRFEEAIAIFKRLEEVAPAEPMVNTNLSLYYMKIGDKATAESHAALAAEKSAAGDAADGRSADDVARERAEARRADAERKRAMFEQVLEIDPDDPVALFGLGTALGHLDAWADAEQTFARAIAAQKTNSAVYLGRGKALEKLARYDDAIDVYRAGIEVASKKGDLMPLKEMENRMRLLEALAASGDS